MKKIFFLTLFVIASASAQSATNLFIEFPQKNKISDKKKLRAEIKMKFLVPPDFCTTAYENQTLNIAIQTVQRFAACRRSNEIVENFDLQACNNQANALALSAMNLNQMGYMWCMYYSSIFLN